MCGARESAQLHIPAPSAMSAGEGASATSGRPWPQRALRLSASIILACLLALSAAAWVVSARQSMRGSMGGIVPLVQAGHHDMGAGMEMEAPQMGMDTGETAVAVSIFLSMWVTMMVAMMFPAVAPMVIAHWRIAARRDESPLSVPLFIGSYLAVWSASGAFAYLLYRLTLAFVPPMPARTAGVLAGGIVAIAGIYQLTPLKWACLKACRTPFQHFFSWRPGLRGGTRMGARHGLSCLGCCWALMLVHFVVGLMNLVWMGVLAAVIFAEKVLPFGALTAKPLGLALVALGLVIAAWPAVLV